MLHSIANCIPQETPEEPKPLDASLDTALESPDAAAARQFATSSAADSIALTGAVLSAAEAAPSALPTNPEAAAAQLEAWREVRVGSGFYINMCSFEPVHFCMRFLHALLAAALRARNAGAQASGCRSPAFLGSNKQK